MAGERTRVIWEDMSPELKQVLGDLATNNTGGQITPEMEAAIKGNMAQDTAQTSEGGEQ